MKMYWCYNCKAMKDKWIETEVTDYSDSDRPFREAKLCPDCKLEMIEELGSSLAAYIDKLEQAIPKRFDRVVDGYAYGIYCQIETSNGTAFRAIDKLEEHISTAMQLGVDPMDIKITVHVSRVPVSLNLNVKGVRGKA